MDLMKNLSDLCEQHIAMIKDEFWQRAKARLEAAFREDPEGEQSASGDPLTEAAKRAFEKNHRQFIMDCIGTNFALIDKELEKVILAECDPEVLAEFVAGENGLVANTLLEFSTATEVGGQHSHQAHMCLNGFNALIKRVATDWQEPLCKVAEVLEGYYILHGGAPDHLQKRFDGILGGGCKLPAQPVTPQQTAPPRKIEGKVKLVASPPVPSGHNPFAAALKGYKPNGAGVPVN